MPPSFVTRSLPRWACLVLLTPWLSTAQPLPGASFALAPPSADSPEAPAARLEHQGIALRAGSVADAPLLDWKSANAAVGAFPRGHADLLQWEARHPPEAGAPPAPPGAHHHPAGARP
ncbi:MAG: hypothetical protein PHI55_15150 [Burkholderiaceae bacterium]|nr:hypothetical protein [Burkholderiaceae bacterium]